MPSFDANAAIKAAKERAREANKPSARLKAIVKELEDIRLDVKNGTSVMELNYHIHDLTVTANALEDHGE